MADAVAIAAAVEQSIVTAATHLRPDALAALEEALVRERSQRAQGVLRQLVDNARIAAEDHVPLCQDTGTVWVLIESGAEDCLGADVYERVDRAVAAAFASAGLRMSVAVDALFDRSNTGDNTPAFVDVVIRPGRGATVHVMLKGGGSDNASRVVMLDPAEGEDGVVRVVLEAVRAKASSACPPLVVGVGVGGTFDKVAALSKRALLREIGCAHADVQVVAFERRLLDAVNDTGIGPAGLGGDTTALAVHVHTAPCHIAALPVAVNLGCCAVRSVSVHVP